jgi:hypothetical protein
MRETKVAILDCGDWQTTILLDGDRIVDNLTWEVLYNSVDNTFTPGLDGYVKDGLLRAWYEYLAITEA